MDQMALIFAAMRKYGLDVDRLRAIAETQGQAFYHGEIAQAQIVELRRVPEAIQVAMVEIAPREPIGLDQRVRRATHGACVPQARKQARDQEQDHGPPPPARRDSKCARSGCRRGSVRRHRRCRCR